MLGRGITLFIASFLFLCFIVPYNFAAPPSENIEYSTYFTRPERDEKQGIVFVFYNNFIDVKDDVQFGYALLYGLEYAAEIASPDDVVAVGIYFTNNKGKIYLIVKAAFDNFHQQKITADGLLKYLTIKEVDLAEKPAPKTTVKK
jgi:hypothetical protein